MARPLTLLLLALLLLFQGQLWLGRGSVIDVMQRREILDRQKLENQQSRLRNQMLEAELRDLKEGREMLEERARRDMGMVRQSEIFVLYSRPKP